MMALEWLLIFFSFFILVYLLVRHVFGLRDASFFKRLFNDKRDELENFEKLETISFFSVEKITAFLLINSLFALMYYLANRLSTDAVHNIAGSAGVSEFFETVYFSIITGGTVGYGDHYPTNAWTKILVSIHVLILLGFTSSFFLNLKRYLEAIYGTIGPSSPGGGPNNQGPQGGGSNGPTNSPTTPTVNNKLDRLKNDVDGISNDLKNLKYLFSNNLSVYQDVVRGRPFYPGEDLEPSLEEIRKDSEKNKDRLKDILNSNALFESFKRLENFRKDRPIQFEMELDLFIYELRISGVSVKDSLFVRVYLLNNYF